MALVEEGANSARERGAALLGARDYAGAATALREAVAQTPNDAGVWQMLGGALAQSGDSAGAVDAFGRAVALAPTAARAHFNLALALEAVGRTEEARESLQRSLALEPGYAPAIARLKSLTPPEPPVWSATPTPIGSPFDSSTAYAPPVADAYAPPLPVLGMHVSMLRDNTSGMQGDVPPQAARGWNWGAFTFGWIWLFAHGMKTYGWIMLFLPNAMNAMAKASDNAVIQIVVSLTTFGIPIALGLFGNRLAWQNRRFDSLEDFKACERIWAYWSLGFIGVVAVLVGAIFLFG